MASQQQASYTPLELRDRLRTPQFVFDWISKTYDFHIDVCADHESTKCMTYFDEEIDGLAQNWHEFGKVGWCNPPYSNPKPWLEKAHQESLNGFTTVFLLPTPNGENTYRDHVFDKAYEIMFINGRLSFIAPEDFTVKGKKDKHFKKGDEIKGDTRGSCFIIFSPKTASTKLSHIDRDEMKGNK